MIIDTEKRYTAKRPVSHYEAKRGRRHVSPWIAIVLYTLLASALCPPQARAAMLSENLEYQGYLKFLHTAIVPEDLEDWTTSQDLQGRLDLSWYPTRPLALFAGIRSRFIYGELVERTRRLERLLDQDILIPEDSSFLELSYTFAKGDSYLLNAELDRLYADLSIGNWVVRAGRHRINWGRNLVWNPNDIFNTFSFLNFDYEERPGTDAISAMYYTGFASGMQLVWELGRDVDRMALVGRYRFNRRQYDFQLLGGLAQEDLVAGAGWSGQIAGGAFRGEVTYLHPADNSLDTTGVAVASVSGDYTFDNQTYVQASILLDSEEDRFAAAFEPIDPDIGARAITRLTATHINLFGQIRYPFTPLISGDLSAILSPQGPSAVLFPQTSFSVSQNTELLLLAQLYLGDDDTEFGAAEAIGSYWLYGRFRWSF